MLRSAIALFWLVTFITVSAETSADEKARGWSVKLDCGCEPGVREVSEPVVDGGLVYVGDRDGVVHALDADTGAQRWRFQSGAHLQPDQNAVLVPPGTSLGGQVDQAMKQVDRVRESGRRLITATPAVAGGSVYVGSWDRRMYSLDSSTGILRWAYDAHAPIAAGALVDGDLLLFATLGAKRDSPGRVVALDRKTGSEVWSFTEHLPRGRLHDRLTLRDGVLYVVTWDTADYPGTGAELAQTWIRALDAATGKELWVAHVVDAWPSRPTITARHVLFMTSPRDDLKLTRLRALDRTTGRESWTYEGRGAAQYWQSTLSVHEYRPPLVFAEQVALFASDIYVAGIEVESGRELWRMSEPFTKKFLNQYELGSVLYVITGETLTMTVGEFMGIDVTTGATKWRRDMQSRNTVEATLDGNAFILTSLLRVALVEIDGRTGKELGTVWRPSFFGNVSSTVCAGPLRSGDLLLLSTSREEFAGGPTSRGHLYAISTAKRKR